MAEELEKARDRYVWSTDLQHCHFLGREEREGCLVLECKRGDHRPSPTYIHKWRRASHGFYNHGI
jgi:hypothetical protein